VQIAKAMGAKVIAACSPTKAAIVREHGKPDFVVDYTKQNWQKEVMTITGGHGIDVVYDPVGRIRGT
jgi:NADPH2:quinone reductase